MSNGPQGALAADLDPLRRLICAGCRTPLVLEDSALVCPSCGRRYARTGGIPVFLASGVPYDEGQAAFFDKSTNEDFEIERPSGTARFYGWLLQEKFRRAVQGVELRGRSVLVVCGGSGMDAELLLRAGARDVVSTDLSIGASRRAGARAKRHGLRFTALVADLEHLPFADRSFDVVYVHDGLHHLERPLSGLSEMARVARYTVCVTEPAQALATRLAVRLGISETVEEAGNQVARVKVDELRRTLEAEGFDVSRASRYAMFYRHEPGFFIRLFSRRLLLPLACASVRIGNVVLSRIGNKVAVVGARR